MRPPLPCLLAVSLAHAAFAAAPELSEEERSAEGVPTAVRADAAPDAPVGSGSEAARRAADGIPRAWLAGVQRHLAAREYWASESAGGLQAPNRAQNLRTWFHDRGVRIHSRLDPGAGPLVALSLAALGRPGALAPVGPGVLRHDGPRVELARSEVLEWYENRPEGLEQGFTLATRPAGAGVLLLGISVEGASVRPRGEGVVLASATGRRLVFGSVRAFDATGRNLPVQVATPAAGEIRIAVEDADAVYPVTVDPLLSGVEDTLIEANQAGAELGLAVAGAGDVNADGYDDVIVGAPSFDAGEFDEGAAFLFLGSATGIADGSPASAASQVEADQVGAALGASVAAAGDVNGDGFADVIVGAPRFDAGESDEGAAFVFLGSAGGLLGTDPSSASAQIESDQSGARLGTSVAAAGDVNGDGFADVIVGAPRYSAGQVREGAAFVFHGSALGIPNGTPATAPATLQSDQAQAELGTSVAAAGDVNGDGFADVIVGAPLYDGGQGDEGAAFVFHGSATGVGDGTPATAEAAIEADQTGAHLGQSVAAAGDVNGDAYGDVIVGAVDYDAGQANEGAAFVFLGSAQGIASGGPPAASAQLESDQIGSDFGLSVAGAGDVNGDGYADVIVGARFFDAGQGDEGAAFVFPGGATGVQDGSPATALATVESDQATGFLGQGVAGAGDVNADGFADVIVGAPSFDAGETGEGAAFVYLGSAAGIEDGDPTTADTVLQSDQVAAALGSSVAHAGDVNGDGFSDIAVGAPDFDAGEPGEGAVFVFHGAPGGIPDGSPPTAATTLEGDQAGAAFGSAVAGAGDVTGDGFADLVVGAPGYDGGENDEGAAFLFAGGPAGIPDGGPASALSRVEADQADAEFGASVAGAGDVDGDGFPDVVVGAPRFDSGEVDEGVALVFAGGPGGIANGGPGQAAARIEADQAGAELGRSVAGAGDVNGDGFADLVVGAPLFDGGEVDEGTALVFTGGAAGIPSGGPGLAAARIEADQAGAHLGASVGAAGDVNADAFGDVLAGAPDYDLLTADEGLVLVFHGGPTGPASGGPGAASSRLEGDQPGASFGASAAGAGDLNGDGRPDVVVGAPAFDLGQADEGAVFVFLSGPSGVPFAGPATADAVVEGNQAGARLGTSVAGAGDVDGDGFADLLVGAPGYDAGEVDEGVALVFAGNGGAGAPVRPRSLRPDGSGLMVHPWGLTRVADTLRVELVARHPDGSGRVAAEVEACPPGTVFGDPGCTTASSPFETVDPLTPARTLMVDVTGLAPGTLTRWRARVLRAPALGPIPPDPDPGPWRRFAGQAVEADARVAEPPACSNGADDDGDGLVDLADPGCSGPGDTSEQEPSLPCDNGLDDDGDGLVDLADPGCSGPADASETDPSLVCDNGLDDDGDGLVDAADPGCAGPTDPTETDPALVCDNTLDDDGDGLADAADPGCAGPADPSEQDPGLPCDNGADDDGDGLVDLADPGCPGPADPDEKDPSLVCDNGLDDDGDGLVDLADPNCTDPTDPSEAPACSPTPRTCREDALNVTLLKDKDEPADGFVNGPTAKVVFKWVRGGAITSSELGDPVADGVHFCFYVDGTLRTALTTAPGSTKWIKAIPDKIFQYKGPGEDGLLKVILSPRSTPGKSKIVVVARGAGIGQDSGLPIPAFTPGVGLAGSTWTAQLQVEGAPSCFGMGYDPGDPQKAPEVLVNRDLGIFKVKRQGP